MFDYSAAHWLAFFTASLLLTLSPGPDLAFILAQTAKRGRSAGFTAMFGIWTGAFFHVFLAALGLSAILATSATAFGLVKLAGASYLVWLGLQSFMSTNSVNPPTRINLGNTQVFQQGVIVAALNPKTAIFFLSFLPQFVVPDAGPASAQLLLHGSLVIAVAVFVEPLLIVLSAQIAAKLAGRPSIGLWADRGLGALFIAMGLRLVFLEQS